jgi:hypothetical protein
MASKIRRGAKIDLTGKPFGNWAACLHKTERVASGWKSYWLCPCSCGATHWVKTATLTNGGSRGCKECAVRRNRKTTAATSFFFI